MDPKVNNSECSLSSDPFDLVLGEHAVAFGFLLNGNASFMNFIGFCLQMLVQR